VIVPPGTAGRAEYQAGQKKAAQRERPGPESPAHKAMLLPVEE
jgi:hypothetical protein